MGTRSVVFDDVKGILKLGYFSQSFTDDDFDVQLPAGEETFTLVNGTILSNSVIDVHVNGVKYREDSDYVRSVALNQIIFVSKQNKGSWINIRVW